MSRNDKSEMSVDRRGGVFVMYNCARLSNLFHNFEKAVHQGILIHYILSLIQHINWSLNAGCNLCGERWPSN